ncbi:MAG: rhodanese-like domain-containing protein [Myxococcota bacterium]
MIRRILRRLLRRKPTKSYTNVAQADMSIGEPSVSDVPEPEIDLEIDRTGLEAWHAEGTPFEILDIREPYEYRQGVLRPSVLIPMNDIPEQLSRFDKSVRWVVVCAAGMRSFGVAHYMRENGFDEAWSMVGGLGTWADQGYGHAPNRSNFGLGDWVSWSENDQRVRGRIQWIEIDGDEVVITVLPEHGNGLEAIQKIETELKRN